MMQPMQVTLFIVGMVIIIVAAYYVTYFIGVKSSGASRGRIRNRNINLLDRFSISKDKSFCLIEIAGKVYVVGVTNQSMTLLDTLDAATFAGTAAERGGASSWQAPRGSRGAGTGGTAVSGGLDADGRDGSGVGGRGAGAGMSASGAGGRYRYSSRMTKRLASFIAARMGRPDPNEDDLASIVRNSNMGMDAGTDGEPGLDQGGKPGFQDSCDHVPGRAGQLGVRAATKT